VWVSPGQCSHRRLFDASPADPLMATAFPGGQRVMGGGRTVDWDADVAALVRRVRRAG
jgi:hypothetical protein